MRIYRFGPPFNDSCDSQAEESEEDLKQLSVNVLTAPEQITTATEFASTQPPRVLPQETSASVIWENDAWKAEDFISFLSSQENSAFGEGSRVWMDVARPLSEYHISCSHNTYLVGHQLMGASTIEGYIRALLHSCRCVERKWHPNFIPPLVPSPHIWSSLCSTVDIYDDDCEPAVCHGRTFTSKVPVREVCEAIAKYGFVTSPYPVAVYAEVHCGLDQQDMLTNIMKNVFGDALVSAPIEDRQTTDVLRS